MHTFSHILIKTDQRIEIIIKKIIIVHNLTYIKKKMFAGFNIIKKCEQNRTYGIHYVLIT